MKTMRRSIREKSCAGFTLLELMGVMVVIAILLAVTLPGVVDLIRIQRAVDEGRELPGIAAALKLGILREQAFPLYQNSETTTTSGNLANWWNLASRHGGGSADEVRYPLGVGAGADTPRKLYFAKTDWSGRTFFEIVDDGQTWLNDPKNPVELRLLLLSTTNPDLRLPDELTPLQFNKFWDEWAFSPSGDPTGGPSDWSDYGLNPTAWTGRAPELQVERIDLRDWLCTVAIENRRAIDAQNGTSFKESSSGYPLIDDWLWSSVYVYPENQVGTEVILRSREVIRSEVKYLQVVDIDLAKLGLVVDESKAVSIKIKGTRIISEATEGEANGNSEEVNEQISLDLADRAPMALLNPEDVNNPRVLSGWGIDDDYQQNRYYLPNQVILLGEPLKQEDQEGQEPVGKFMITQPFDTLRFDGLRWHY